MEPPQSGPSPADRGRTGFRDFIRAFGPAMLRPQPQEIVRAAIGGGIALAVCGLILTGVHLLFNDLAKGIILVAPLGATTFLLFAVPNSPLSQPWSCIIGNTASAVVAVFVIRLELPLAVASGLSVGGAIAAMGLLRALHPPGAAVALSTVLGAGQLDTLGYNFALVPVMLDTTILVLVGLAWNRLTGRSYLFRQLVDTTTTAQDKPYKAPARPLGLSTEDLEELLNRFNLSANLGTEDFALILASAEEEVARRRFEGQTCGDIMSRELITVEPGTPLDRIAELFSKHRFKTLPVVDSHRHLKGIVSQNDLIQKASREAVVYRGTFAAARELLKQATKKRNISAGDIMTAQPETVTGTTPIGDLVNLLADDEIQAVPVIDDGILVGIVTRSDLIAVFARSGSVEALPGPQASPLD
ncbi:HPP family protein [Kineobactrum sediminis]|nr:HPP family protein [Kineobactrum sediminis]